MDDDLKQCKKREISLSFLFVCFFTSCVCVHLGAESVLSLLQLEAASELSYHAGSAWTCADTEIPVIFHSPLLWQASAGTSRLPILFLKQALVVPAWKEGRNKFV